MLAERVDVEVPVAKQLRFRYQHSPLEPIEDGWRWIEFNPPAERLQRRARAPVAAGPLRAGSAHRRRPSPDRAPADAARRAAGLRASTSAAGLEPPSMVSIDGEPLADLRQVRGDWRMRTVGPVVPATIEGRKVILQRPLAGLRWGAARSLRRRAARLGGDARQVRRERPGRLRPAASLAGDWPEVIDQLLLGLRLVSRASPRGRADVEVEVQRARRTSTPSGRSRRRSSPRATWSTSTGRSR